MNVPRRHLLHLALGAAALPTVSRVAAGQGQPTPTLAATVFGNPSILDAPMVAGTVKGIFEKHGVSIQATPVATGFEAAKKVSDGGTQVGAAAPTALAQTIGQGARLKALFASNGDATGAISTDSYIAVVARGNNGIREGHLEDLRGKKVAVRRGSDFHQFLLSALIASAIDPDTVAIVDTADLLGALQTGTVDAVVSPEANASRIRETVGGAILVGRGGNYMQFLELRVVTPEFLSAHSQVLKRYVTGFAEAAQFVRGHLDETTDIMMQQHLKGMNRELVRAGLGFLHADPRVSKVTARAVEEGSDFAIRIGALKTAIAFEEMFDVNILREVEREHPELFSDLPPIPDALKL
jgi:ABC-type nitrate/sulfonate/bicarbonate transport system substrate-binding protein